jgi:hypothetical protein
MHNKSQITMISHEECSNFEEIYIHNELQPIKQAFKTMMIHTYGSISSSSAIIMESYNHLARHNAMLNIVLEILKIFLFLLSLSSAVSID